MALSQRLRRVEDADVATGGRDAVVDAIRQRVHEQLIAELGPLLSDADVPPDEARRKVHDALIAAIDADRVPLSAAKRNALVRDLTDDILVMRGGEVLEQGLAREVLEAPQHPYTRSLIEAVPGGHTRSTRLAPDFVLPSFPEPPEVPDVEAALVEIAVVGQVWGHWDHFRSSGGSWRPILRPRWMIHAL